MSILRLPLRSLTLRFDRGSRVADHAFGWGQLVHARQGVGRVETERGHWVLATQRALWVPPGVRHVLHCTTTLELQSLYFPAEHLPPLPEACTVLVVEPLLRELVGRAAGLSVSQHDEPRARRLLAVLRDELAEAAREPLALPLPQDAAARALARALLAAPGARSIDEHCTRAGASRRTLERRFRAETGTSLGAWARQARLHHALSLLGRGRAVREVAETVGYASPSAFVVAFQRSFGTTPARYFEARKA